VRTKNKTVSRRTKVKTVPASRRTKQSNVDLPSYYVGCVLEKNSCPRAVIVDDHKLCTDGQWFTVVRLCDGVKAREQYTAHDLWVYGYMPKGELPHEKVMTLRRGHKIDRPRRANRLKRDATREKKIKMRAANIRGHSRRTK